MKKPAVGFGLHLTLDGYGCSYERLTNLDAIYEFLDTCPDMIHMTKIMPPYVFKYHGKVPDDWGVSGFVLIAESHISIHTFPERGYLSLDIFSCKDFDYQQAVDYATELLRHCSPRNQLVGPGPGISPGSQDRGTPAAPGAETDARLSMEEADSPHPSFLKRLRQMFSRRIITQPEDLEREIQHIIDEGEERGLITRQEGQLIESIFEFRDTLVREIMVPRLEMVGVERHTPLDQIIALVISCGHSRLPVFDGDIDHIKGILLAKDLLVFWQTPDTTWDPARVLRPAYFIPESKKISDLLRDLVERKTQIAVVIDEYGGTAGLITLEDILEEIVGEIYDEYDRRSPASSPRKTAPSWWTPAWTWKN